MNPVFQSLRETVKHGLAIVLFILLLLGMMGAGLGIFSAGITALSTHQPPIVTEPAVPALSGSTSGAGSVSQASQTQGAGSNGYYPGASQGSNQGSSQAGAQGVTSAQSSTQSATPSTTQNNNVGWSGPSQTVPPSMAGQDLASRMDRKLRDMQSPVTGRLDTGGVALGDQVQSAFGRLLSGLLQTLFVEQAGSQPGAVGSSRVSVTGNSAVSGSNSQDGAVQGSSSQGTN